MMSLTVPCTLRLSAETCSQSSEVMFGGLQGIVGGTYDRYLEGEDAVSKPEDQLYIPEDVSVPSTFLLACKSSEYTASCSNT